MNYNVTVLVFTSPIAALLVCGLLLLTGAEPDPSTSPPPREGEGAPAAPSGDEREAESPPELTPEMLERLARQADAYREYALRLSCVETVRLAEYDLSGEASKEATGRHSYLLERDRNGDDLRELRQVMRPDGSVRGIEAQDEESFPPAYGWVFLFSRFNQPYFSYRDLGDRFDGFDWVREIRFKGALPYTDGRDIRQWEGTVLVDAARWTPLEIRTEPSGQRARIRALYERWTRAFEFIGMRLAPRPFGYRCRVQFHLRRDGLTFPTELRYDTFRAVGPKTTIPTRASIRQYEDYRFFKVETEERPGDVAGS